MGGSSKAQTIGYKYYLGVHAVFHIGHADKVVRLAFPERDKAAWEGDSAGGTINVAAEQLFGGEEPPGEGGVSGVVDFEKGLPSQLQNSYLLGMLGAYMPAFRGVTALVFRSFYFGMSRYLKAFSATFQRIHIATGGVEQWYDGKAAISYSGVPRPDDILFDINANDSFYVHPTWIDGGGYVIDGLDPEQTYRVTVEGTADGRMYDAWSYYPYPTEQWWVSFHISRGGVDNTTLHFEGPSYDPTIAEARARLTPLFLTGYSEYMFWMHDNFLSNQGGLSFRFSLEATGTTFDMNPAHIIRECLIDADWGMGYDEAEIDNVSFTASADRLYSEQMGMSLLWDKEMPIEDFIKEVVKHISAALYVDRVTGLFTLDLIRNDYDVEDLLTLDTSNIERVSDFKQPVFGELITSVTVNYWDALTGKDASKTLSDDALAAMQRAEINTTIQYIGFTNSSIVDRVLQRDLAVLSTPLVSCTIYANREAADLKLGKCFKWTWPDYEIEDLVMRITGVAYGNGKDNRIRLTVTQDIFNLPEVVFTPPTPPIWEDPTGGEALPLEDRLPIEVPYFEMLQRQGSVAVDAALAANPDLGYVGIAAGVNTNEINAKVLTDAGAGYQQVAVLDFSPTAKLAEALTTRQETTFDIENGESLDEVAIGTIVQLNDELMSVEVLSETSITVKRAVLDTTPGEHVVADTLYFWDNTLSIDSTEYLVSDSVDIKLLTVTGSKILAEGDAPVDNVAVAGRAARPYPPGQFKINTLTYPPVLFGNLVVSWVHRDRLAQGDQLVGTVEAGIGPEAGTTYNIRYYIAGVLVHTSTAVAGTTDTYVPVTNGAGRIELEAVRDGLVSWQIHEHDFSYTILPVLRRVAENGDVRITETSDNRVTEY